MAFYALFCRLCPDEYATTLLSCSKAYRYDVPYRIMRNGWPSVLNTQLSKLATSTSENVSQRYFNVSAAQKLSCMSTHLSSPFVCVS